MDELEKQIRESRAELDAVERFDAPGIWRATEERLAGASARRRRLGWRAGLASAAAVLLLVVLSLLLRPRPQEQPTLQLADLSPELARQETDLRDAILAKERSLHLDELDRRRYGTYFEELHNLDSLHTEYLADLPEFGHKERLVFTLLRVYELKIQLLLQLENELLKQENYDLPDPSQEI